MRRARPASIALLLAAVALATPALAAKDYLLAGQKPDKLVLVDVGGRKIERSYTLRDGAPGPVMIVPSPDGRVAYVIVNRSESLCGIDLDTGQEVFRADFSKPPERVKAFAAEISPDGKELFVY